MPLLYIDHIPAAGRSAFGQKVEGIASHLGIHPDWLMQVMKAESGLRPTAANYQGAGGKRHLVAAGLIQFTKGSGIVSAGVVPSIAHILKMSALAQLDLVRWYFSPFRGRMKSYYDVYAVTFFPAMIGKPDSWVLQTKSLSAATVAHQNKGIAKGKNHITVADFKRYAIGLVPKSARARVFGSVQQLVDQIKNEVEVVKDTIETHPKESIGIGVGSILALGFLGWYILKSE